MKNKIIKSMLRSAIKSLRHIFSPLFWFFNKANELKRAEKYWSLLFSGIFAFSLTGGMIYLLLVMLSFLGSHLDEIILIMFPIVFIIIVIKDWLFSDEAAEPAPAPDITSLEKAKALAARVHPILANAMYVCLSQLTSVLPIVGHFTPRDLECSHPYAIDDGITYHYFITLKNDTHSLLPVDELNHIKKLVQETLSTRIANGDCHGLQSGILLDQYGLVKDPVVIDRVQDTGNYLMFTVALNDPDYEKRGRYIAFTQQMDDSTTNHPSGNF